LESACGEVRGAQRFAMLPQIVLRCEWKPRQILQRTNVVRLDTMPVVQLPVKGDVVVCMGQKRLQRLELPPGMLLCRPVLRALEQVRCLAEDFSVAKLQRNSVI